MSSFCSPQLSPPNDHLYTYLPHRLLTHHTLYAIILQPIDHDFAGYKNVTRKHNTQPLYYTLTTLTLLKHYPRQ